MPEYETRIKNCDGDLSLKASSQHPSDFAAIRAAKRLCSEGQTIEIWRDEFCVYSEPQSRLTLVWPKYGGAVKVAGKD